MSNGILVFIEQRNGQIRKSSLEAVSEAKRLAQGNPVTAVLVGNETSQMTAALQKVKPEKILLIDNALLADYSTEGYATALATAIKTVSPKLVFAGHTSMAKDLIPRLAARFDAGCVTDVTEIRAEGDKLLFVHPIYSGKARGIYEFNSPLGFVTLRPNVFTLSEYGNGTPVTEEALAVNLDKIRAKVTETHAAEGQKIELSEARVVVAGGRGIKGPENWGILQSLCDVLGAALGASRAVVDSGWIDHQHQVGQTGKTVSPQLYIACGVSGAIQHLAGMSSSKVIVAINKDADAPIFKHATYGIVGDVFEVVPKLTEELKRQGIG